MAEAVVLCGGQGWRLKADTWVPKPLLHLPEGKTLIQHQVEFLAENGFERIILATKKGLIPTSQFDWPPDVEVIASEEEAKLGTGGAIKNAFRTVDAEAYVMNVDDIILGPYDPTSLRRCGAPAALLLNRARSRFGTVNVDDEGFVTTSRV
jgi:D-glycero-alpha-D-manno-heptose 1-phosphate guanylyltransferase